MKLNPYLMFDGNCEAAVQYYQQHLGCKVQAMLRYSEMPASAHEGPQCAPPPPEFADRIMHACLDLDGGMLMASDATPQCPYEGVKGCSVVLHADSVTEAERVFAALSDNGSVQMPLGPTFWAVRFGVCTDRFGVPWMINCEKEQ